MEQRLLLSDDNMHSNPNQAASSNVNESYTLHPNFFSDMTPSSKLLNKHSVLDATSSSPCLSSRLMPGQLTKPRSAGDIIMYEMGLHELPEVNERLLPPPRSQTENNIIEVGQDVQDSVPCRPVKEKILPKDVYPASNLSISSSDTSPQASSSQEFKKARCCEVFCALLEWEHIFTDYTFLDLCLNIGGIALYIFDLVTDWLNAFYYLYRNEEEDDIFYFVLSVIFIVIPSIVLHVFSMWWEVDDNQQIKKNEKKSLRRKLGRCYCFVLVLLHICQVAPVYRYCRTVYYGVTSRKKKVEGDNDESERYSKKYKDELRDVNFIRLKESLLEAAPQLVLQLFIMITTAQAPTITVLSVCVSLCGMSISFVSYQRALRNTLTEKAELLIIPSCVLLVYRFFTNASRVLALALLLNINAWVWIGFFLIHWLVMVVFILIQKTEFYTSKAKEVTYNVVTGLCYNFAYFNVHADTYNRYKMAAYYSLTFIVNTVIAVCWFYFRKGGGDNIIHTLLGKQDDGDTTEEDVLSSETALIFMVAVISSYAYGMVFFFMYYLACHPMSEGVSGCINRDSFVPLSGEIEMKETRV